MSFLFRHPWGLYFFAVVGVLAACAAVGTLFFALGRRPDALRAPFVPTLENQDDFLLALAGTVNAPTRAGGTVQALHNGDQIFPAILEAIRGAEHTVNFMAYIWRPGRVSDMIFAALLERARAGVQVRVMLDGLGGIRTEGRRLKELEMAGGKVCRFRPFHVGQITRFYKRNHRRSIVVDGRIGFTGGAAVSDEWLGDAERPGRWRDAMFRVTGSLAHSLQAVFTEIWASVYGEILVGPAFYPVDLPVEEAGGDGMEVSRHVNVISSPSHEAHPLRKLFWISFMAARRRLWITTPYFVPDKHLRRALRYQARAGVDVRLLLPGAHTDARPIRRAARSYYRELMDAGVRIYEYQPTFLHLKAMTADGVWSVIGSANQDIRSKELNEENVLGILDRGFAAQLEDTFRRDLERAREITLDEWRGRGVWERVMERFWVLFAEQY